MIQCARTKQRRPKDSEDDSNEAEMDSPEVDWFQLQVNTLRRYKRHYKVPARPGLNKAQLADVSIALFYIHPLFKLVFLKIINFFFFRQAIQKHFKSLPVNEKEIMTYFIYMVKTNGNKLDQKNGMNSDSV